MIEPRSPDPAYAAVRAGILWTHPEPIDPWWWRQIEVALGTGDLDSLVTARLSALDYRGLP